MKINEKIYENLKGTGIKIGDALLFMMSNHFNIDSTLITSNIKTVCGLAGLTIMNKDSKGYRNLIPLFSDETLKDSAWDWVDTEYISLFKSLNITAPKKDVIIRMKNLFSENPDIRKDDVIKAAKMYIENTDVKYIQQPHYFILKGIGVAKTQNILIWVDKVKKQERITDKRDETRNLR
jgi:hypothetical protein